MPGFFPATSRKASLPMHINLHIPGHPWPLGRNRQRGSDGRKGHRYPHRQWTGFSRPGSCGAVSEVSQLLTVVKRSIANIDLVTLPLIYKTLVRPFLEYGNVVWGPFGKTDQKRLERVQRRAIRLAHDVRRIPYSDRLRILKIPSLLCTTGVNEET